MNDEVVAALRAVLEPELGPVNIEGLARLSAGTNRETWSFDAVVGERDRHELILQRERAGATNQLGSCAREASVLRAALAAGVPVADVLVSGDPSNPLERSFTINRRLDGETIGRRILREAKWRGARESFVADCAAALSRIHALDPDAFTDNLSTLDDPVAFQRSLYDFLGDPHPVFELGFRWLEQNRPATRPVSVVHGDFRLGNLLVDETGLAAVLDWELCHLGNPIEDLGWLCVRAWRFGGKGPVAGIGERQELREAYRASSGVEVDASELRWWEVFGVLRWGVTCMYMTNEHRTGSSRSVELATIGRRVVENEYDLLMLLPELLGR